MLTMSHLLPLSRLSQGPEPTTAPITAPLRIGLALGGGVARGWAHIGAMRALERMGIVPDVIAGTSIGAIVGGCWLAGRMDELEAWARSLTRRRMFSYLDINLKGGILGGAKLVSELEAYMPGQLIEDLGKPFVAIATDLSSGHEVWLTQGSLSEALNASFALPGIFAPVMLEGRTLVDGALTNPVPVSALVGYGVDLTIAINLNADTIGKVRRREEGGEEAPPPDDAPFHGAAMGEFPLAAEPEAAPRRRQQPLFQLGSRKTAEGQGGLGAGWLGSLLFRKDEDRPSLFGAMISSLTIITDRIGRAKLAAEPPDIHLAPRIAHIGAVEFDRAAELIDAGEACVESNRELILDAVAAATERTQLRARRLAHQAGAVVRRG